MSLKDINFLNKFNFKSGKWRPYQCGITGSIADPTKGATSIDKGSYRIYNGSVELFYQYQQSGAGASGTGDYLFSTPGGIVANQNFVIISGSITDYGDGSVVGTCSAEVAGNVYYGFVTLRTNNGLVLNVTQTGPVVSAGAALFGLANASVGFTIRANFPIY